MEPIKRILLATAFFGASLLAFGFMVLPIAAIFVHVPVTDLLHQFTNPVVTDALIVSLKTIVVAQITILLLGTPWRRYELRAISLVLLLIGALFEIYLRYVEQAHFGGHVCMWCVSFMAFWWIAGACEIGRAHV